MRRDLRPLSVACALALLVTSCVGKVSDVTPSVDTSLESQVRIVQFLPAPKGGTFATPVFLPATGQIVVTYFPPRAEGWDVHLYSIDPTTAALTRLPLPDEPDCSRGTAHSVPSLLGDGRLAYASSCYGDAPRVPRAATRLMAWDPRTGEVSQLRPYLLHQSQGRYAFAPDLSVGVLNNATGLREQLLWLRPDRLEPLPLPFGRVFTPIWSPDGRWISLPASPGGQDVQGIDRADLPRSIYLLSADGKEVRQLVGGQTGAGAADWSPDGRWLVSTFGISETQDDLMLIEVATGKTYRVLRGRETGGGAFSPDGRRLLVPVGTRSGDVLFSRDKPPIAEVGLLILELPDLSRFATAK